MDNSNQSTEQSQPSTPVQNQHSPSVLFKHPATIALIGGIITVLIFLLMYAMLTLGVRKQTPYQQNTTRVFPSPSPTTASSPAASDADMANWKMYTDTVQGFSFKYPSSWSYQLQPDNTFVWKNANDSIPVMGLHSQLKPITSPLRGDSFIPLEEDHSVPIMNVENFQINNSNIPSGKAYYVSCGGECLFYFLQFKIKNTYYEIRLPHLGYTHESLDTFNQILSTFIFLDQNQTSDSQSAINVTLCKIGEQRILSFGLGSKTIKVKRRDENNCILNYMSEIEGGYTTYQCIIPMSLGEITLSNLDVSKYCMQIKSGNIFLE